MTTHRVHVSHLETVVGRWRGQPQCPGWTLTDPPPGHLAVIMVLVFFSVCTHVHHNRGVSVHFSVHTLFSMHVCIDHHMHGFSVSVHIFRCA